MLNSALKAAGSVVKATKTKAALDIIDAADKSVTLAKKLKEESKRKKREQEEKEEMEMRNNGSTKRSRGL